jgi:AbrB family looped-hinge helix DNA binding protein
MSVVNIQAKGVHHMKVTTAGQISLPAEVRRRWGVGRVRITDEGDRLIIEPASENPFEDLIGILAGPGPTYDELKAEDREVELERESQNFGSPAGDDR